MQSRIFEVLEGVAKHGPITLDEVAKKTGISRSATFRALKRLEEGGWIRQRLNGRQYVLTSKVEKKLNSKIEPKQEIEKLTPIIVENVDLKLFRIRVFQQQTTSSAELVDDSMYNTSDISEQLQILNCCGFLLKVLQFDSLALGGSNMDPMQRIKAASMLLEFQADNFVIVWDHQFLWIPVFSISSEVFFLCVSYRNYNRIERNIGIVLSQEIDNQTRQTGLMSFQKYRARRVSKDIIQ